MNSILLRVIGIIAFAVYAYLLVKLFPILQGVISARKANIKEIEIQGELWKVNYVLLSLTTLPYVLYVSLIVLVGWLAFMVPSPN
jgi:hypothetical protein